MVIAELGPIGFRFGNSGSPGGGRPWPWPRGRVLAVVGSVPGSGHNTTTTDQRKIDT